jgi:hypothetical protein
MMCWEEFVWEKMHCDGDSVWVQLMMMARVVSCAEMHREMALMRLVMCTYVCVYGTMRAL